MKGYIQVHIDTYETVPISRIIENLSDSEKRALFTALGGDAAQIGVEGFKGLLAEAAVSGSFFHCLKKQLGPEEIKMLKRLID